MTGISSLGTPTPTSPQPPGVRDPVVLVPAARARSRFRHRVPRAPAHGRGRASLSVAGPSGARPPQNAKDSGALGACVRFLFLRLFQSALLPCARPAPHANHETRRDARAVGGRGGTRGACASRPRGPPLPQRCAPPLAQLVARSLPSSSISTRPRRPPWPCVQQRLRSSRT